MPFHYEGAYDGFDSLSEVGPHYRRCRTHKDFILSQQGVEEREILCAACSKPITSDNRSEYNPKTKKIKVMHYRCAWDSILAEIYGPLYDAFVGA